MNWIDQLINKVREVLNQTEKIHKKVLSFYQELMGNTNPILQGVDMDVERKGKQLNSEQAQDLIKLVGDKEIEEISSIFYSR